MQRPSESLLFPWYDSQWLSAYAQARAILGRVAPSRLAEFETELDVFRVRPDFQVRLYERVFDDATVEQIRQVTRSLAPAQLELHEARDFKRFVVHNHALFSDLQARLVDLVSEGAGEPVEPCYNFLSLYGAHGVCPPHMDAPQAKWTLDFCIAQSHPWPIHFSPVVDWPQPGELGADWNAEIRRRTSRNGRSFALEPGQALLFGGSNQWHYRDAMPGDGADRFCDLLFFHFIPRGTARLVEPANWAQLFGVPELAQAAAPANHSPGG